MSRERAIKSDRNMSLDEMLKYVQVGEEIWDRANDTTTKVLSKSFEESGAGWMINITVEADPTKPWRSETIVDEIGMLTLIQPGNLLTHPDFPDFRVDKKQVWKHSANSYGFVLKEGSS